MLTKEPGPLPSPLRSRGTARYILAVAGVALLAYFLASLRLADTATILRRTSAPALALAATAVLGNLALKAWRWRRMTEWAFGVRLPWAKALALVPVGVAAGALVPGRAIDLGKPAVMAEDEGVPFGRAVGLAVWERLYDLASLLALGGLAGILCLRVSGSAFSSALLTVSWVLLAAGSTAVAALVFPGPPPRLTRILGGPPAPGVLQRAALGTWSVLALALEAARAELVAAALGWPGRAGTASTAFLLGSLGAVASLVPGGLGIAEWSAGLLLSRFLAGAARVLPEAAVVVMLDRFLSYYVPSIAGGVLMATWHSLFGGRPAAASSRHPAEAALEAQPRGRPAGCTWVVLPAYNEAPNIGSLIARLAQVFRQGAYRVVLVDDGSTDGTAEFAAEAARRHGCPLTVVRPAVNQGLAESLQDGLTHVARRASPVDAILCLDADDTHDPALAPLMLERLADDDVVIASRYRRGAKEVGVPYLRRLMSRCVNLMLRAAVPIPGVRDYTSGYRALRVSLIQRALERYGESLVGTRTFACTAELLLRLAGLGARMSEVPLVLRYDRKQGASKVRIVPTVLEYLHLVGRYALGHPPTSRRLLWAAALILFLVPLSAPLTDGDSHYYAEVAQHMLRSHDWLTPRHPADPGSIVDKPPLTLWLMAASFWLFGVNEVAARLWQVLMGLGLLWLTVDIGRLYR